MHTEAHGELGVTCRPRTDVDPKARRAKYSATSLVVEEAERVCDDLDHIVTFQAVTSLKPLMA